MSIAHVQVSANDTHSLHLARQIISAAGETMVRTQGLEHWAAPYSMENITRDASDKRLYLAYLDDSEEPIATYQLGLESEPRSDGQRWIQIEKFATSPERTGQGIGTAVLNEIQIKCTNSGILGIFLNVYTESHEAIRFYEANGFSKIQRRPTRRFEVWEMEKPLQIDSGQSSTANENGEA